jgi:predicted alpha-1,6-mannanase (GH76 family)
VACYIYQGTNDRDYLDKAVQINDWVRSHLFNEDTGQINTAVYEDGSLDTSAATYSQGTWLDYANLLSYMISGAEKY